MTRVLEPHVGPRLPTVDRLINAITRRDTALRVVLTGSHPQRIAVVWVDLHYTNGV